MAKVHVCHQIYEHVYLYIDFTQVPVFRGCSAHIMGKDIYDSRYHGQDGMGDIANPVEADLGLIKEEHAATAIVRMVNESPGKHLGNIHLT